MKVAILCDATFFSDSFRKAHIKEHIKRKLLDGEDRERFIDKQKEQEAQGHEFFVAMYTPKDYKHFSLDEATFWKARLHTESGEVLAPISIEFVEVTPYTQVMFPYVTRWSYAYRVVFPKEELGKKFTLTMHSPVGETHLHWD